MSNFKPQPTEIHMEAVPDGDNLIQFPASAEEYAVRHGLQGKAVFPVSTRGDYMPKRDGIDGTGGFRRASVDPATVRALYREFAKTYGYECDGVGWALPEGIVALDCDEKPTPSGVERHGWTVDWPKLIDFRDEIPPTLTATTKSAGKHLVFRIPLGLSLDQSEFQRTAPGIDLKGNLTGLIKIEGTPGYRFDNANEIADCPAWLLPMITKPKTERESAPVAATKASNFQVSARMQEWVNRAVRKAKENLAVPRNTAAVWAAQQMRNDLAGMGYDYREEIEPWCEKLRIRLSALKDHEYEAEKMRKVIAGLGEPRPPAENPEKAEEPTAEWPLPSFSTWGDLREADMPPLRGFLGGQLFARQTVNMIAGRRGSKKTYTSLYLATRFAQGEPFGVLTCDRARVLIVSMEMGRRQIQHRLKKLSATGEGFDVVLICKDDFQKGTRIDLNTDDGAEYLRRIVSQHRADIVFVDSLRKVRGAARENDNDEMGRVLDRVEDQVAVPTDSAIIVLHHMGKPGKDGENRGGRGGSVIEDACSDVLYLDKTKGGTWEKTRDSALEGKQFGVSMTDDEAGRIEVEITEGESSDFDFNTRGSRVLAALRECGNGATATDIEKATKPKLSRSVVRQALKDLRESGKVDSPEVGNGRGRVYSLIE